MDRFLTSAAAREMYARDALQYMPKVLTMTDQNPLSTTYGCGDRPYWLYKTVDFPCGMYGEFALPLAFAYSTQFEGNRYFGLEKIRVLAEQVMRFQATSGNDEGSNDDFFPGERAIGSTAFSLYAMAEAAHLIDLKDDALVQFLVKRAKWLGQSEESGRLSNHHALSAAGIASVAALANDPDLSRLAVAKRDKVLSWQTDEGWFVEYDGCDPSYDTFTISFLADLRQRTQDDTLTAPLDRAAIFTADLVGPDGMLGGEIGQRNALHFVPLGFELLAGDSAAARFVAMTARRAIAMGDRPYLDENRTFCHYQCNFFQAAVSAPDLVNVETFPREKGFKYYPRAGLARARIGDVHAVVSVAKSGVVKASTSGGVFASDTGLAFESVDGVKVAAMSTANARLTDSCASDEGIVMEIESTAGRIANTIRQTTFRLFLLRILSMTIGRLDRNFVRRIVQRLVINRKRDSGVVCRRRIHVTADRVVMEDVLERSGTGPLIKQLFSTTDLTTIFTASSNGWHSSRRFLWRELPAEADEFNRSGETRTSRIWQVGE